jgi:predicted TIM-barrel fold metal-dependent hydrolase
MYQDLEIIDFHTHFPTTKPWFQGMGLDTRETYRERRGQRRADIADGHAQAYRDAWRKEWDVDPPEANPPDDETQADRWAQEVDKYGLRAVAFVTGGGNENLARVIQRHPDKFVGFAHHYPFTEDAAEKLRFAVTEYGFRGYKLLAPMLDRPIEDEAAYPVWEVCAELEIPVLIHFGIQGGGGGIAWHANINPLKLHNVAKDFPDVEFVVPHFGCAWIRETKPDVIITHPAEDYHPDHRYTHQMVLDAAQLARVRNYPSDLPPHRNTLPIAFMDGVLGLSFIPEEWVDITDFFAQKVEMLSKHVSQMMPDTYDPNFQLPAPEANPFLRMITLQSGFRGLQCGVAYAEAFIWWKSFNRIVPKRLLP